MAQSPPYLIQLLAGAIPSDQPSFDVSQFDTQPLAKIKFRSAPTRLPSSLNLLSNI